MPSKLFNLPFDRFFSSLKKNIFILAAVLITSINLAHAEEVVPDKFRISLGSYTLVRYDSTMSLTDRDLGAGISISPEDTLGLSTEQTVLRLTGYYRFNKNHALTYSWYSISSLGNKLLEEEFEWLDENGEPVTVPVGAKIDTSLDYDIIKAGYLWSFYHTDKVEMAAGAGLHVTRIAVGLRADTTSTGINTQDISTTVPLPVLSFSLTYHVTSKFSWGLKAEAFALKFDEWDGIYTDSSLAMEYRAFENVGLGIGLNSSSLKITEDASDHKFTFDNRITGVMLFAAAYF